ncbi:hypothetical protein F4776DRAFT_558540 [Hypoxylon sp. NC0597]|nr:hypothetical protein F4776DRAFT_558540 [Hypoxylon sp. NC0597]
MSYLVFFSSMFPKTLSSSFFICRVPHISRNSLNKISSCGLHVVSHWASNMPMNPQLCQPLNWAIVLPKYTTHNAFKIFSRPREIQINIMT